MEQIQNTTSEQNTNSRLGKLIRLGIAALFIIAILLIALARFDTVADGYLLVIAAMIGGYMAMNIGANDVANNVGPAVGSGALTLTSAILIAAVFEAGGAVIAGGDVVSTIKKGIIDPALIADSQVFIWVMMAALMAAAIWLNVATAIGAPVSTTHSIVGGVLGAGIAAAGWDIADWSKVGMIAASWVISPLMGGLIAAGFLYFIKRTIVYRADKILAAKRVVPYLIAVMAWAFATYLVLKGLKKLWKFDILSAGLIGLAIAVAVFFLMRPLVARAAGRLENTRPSINALFTMPLIFAAALLSFAHGANDVANAVGPLAAINDAILHGGIATKAEIPFWVMLVGALGIALGLALFGPRLIRTVGSEITELDKMRAYCVAMAAAITVIIASQLGLPVSSTHIAVGGIFGVGFLREYLESNHARLLDKIRDLHEGDNEEEIESFLVEFEDAGIKGKSEMLKELKRSRVTEVNRPEHKSVRKEYRSQLVKRALLIKIAAAWIITVPLAGAMAALLYFTLRGMLLP